MTSSTNPEQNNSAITSSAKPKLNDSKSNKRQRPYITNYLRPEVIESATPLFLATVGAVLGIAVLFPGVTDAKATDALNLAAIAMAGGAGLARSGRSEQDFSVKQQDGNLEVDTPADRQLD